MRYLANDLQRMSHPGHALRVCTVVLTFYQVLLVISVHTKYNRRGASDTLAPNTLGTHNAPCTPHAYNLEHHEYLILIGIPVTLPYVYTIYIHQVEISYSSKPN